jgi:hypothetical protein
MFSLSRFGAAVRKAIISIATAVHLEEITLAKPPRTPRKSMCYFALLASWRESNVFLEPVRRSYPGGAVDVSRIEHPSGEVPATAAP